MERSLGRVLSVSVDGLIRWALVVCGNGFGVTKTERNDEVGRCDGVSR